MAQQLSQEEQQYIQSLMATFKEPLRQQAGQLQENTLATINSLIDQLLILKRTNKQLVDENTKLKSDYEDEKLPKVITNTQ